MSRDELDPIDFVIVGAQRSGSTHLSNELRRHPQIFLCGDEVPFFEDPFYSNSEPEALAAVFSAARPGQRRGLHCPSYLGHAEVPERLSRHTPSMQIVAVLRDPVARAISTYFWYVQYGLLPLQGLSEGIESLLDGWHDDAYPHAHEVLEWGLYARHLAVYDEHFPLRQISVVLLTDLADGGLGRIHRDLHVEPGAPPPRPSELVGNPGVYDLRRLRWLRARRRLIWSWDETSTYSYRPRRRRRPLGFLLNSMIVGLDRLVLARLLGNDAEPLAPRTRRRLSEWYEDDIGRLEQRLNRNLSGWRS